MPGPWVERDLPCPARLQGRPKAAWSSDDVISHNGRLWWVDLGWGLLGCDPFADEPLALRRMELPFTFDVDPDPNIQGNRIVGVSEGRLRYVDIVRDPIDPDEDTLIVIKFLGVGPDDEERWEYQISKALGDIWSSPSYEATGMPEEVPELALLDPMNGNVIYFFMKEYLFSVNLEEETVVNFIHEAGQPLRWRSVISWELPPHLTNELTATTRSRGATAQGLQTRFCCAVCNSEAGNNICEHCALRVRRKLSLTNASELKVPSIGYCLQCHDFVGGDHTIHEKMKVPIHSYKGEPMAWVTGNESWSSLFNEIESDSGIRPMLGRPFRLYCPNRNNCRVCNDLLPEDELYAPGHKFCTVKCWLEGDEDDFIGSHAARGLLAVNFDSDLDTFCIPCAREGSAGGVEDKLDILIKDDISVRCRKCGIRLADSSCKYCSWECSLQRQLLPRLLQQMYNAPVAEESRYPNVDRAL
ncbi:hypothetical protein EJB05_46075 [Eragrostis curvula]|uniref:DUF1618 domain-containing protein n=1 Tax=Eragrostis curvula TaxID=38414 RepID=A0A5J9TP66_9POAL|nr:hypothetical protein EJB05_46075 [Eragrostis curvula]